MENAELKGCCEETNTNNINLDDIVISDNGCQCSGYIVSDELLKISQKYDSSDAVSLLDNERQRCDNVDAVTLSNNERQRCEVWSRVMGYYRPTVSYNVGKKSEYDDRKCFIEPTNLENKCGDCITRAA